MNYSPESAEQSHAADVDGIVESLEKLRHADRLATLGHVAAYLAHELGSPLNVIEGRTAMILNGAADAADVHRNARIIAEQSARMVVFLRGVVSFARRSQAAVPFDFAVLTRRAVGMFGAAARAREATISIENGVEKASLVGDPDTLLVAIMHILENGLRATPGKGTLVVRLNGELLGSQEDPENPTSPFVCLQVENEGDGIDEQMMPKLFRPFAAKKSSDSSGVGLFIAQAIVKDHGGFIEGTNRIGGGARFSLHLPQGNAHAQ